MNDDYYDYDTDDEDYWDDDYCDLCGGQCIWRDDDDRCSDPDCWCNEGNEEDSDD